MIRYLNSDKTSDLEQIIALQAANLPSNISDSEAKEQGFVTVQHPIELLQKMGAIFPHTIAKDGDKVVGYVLTMTRDFRAEIPILIPMFDLIDSLTWDNKLLCDLRYVVVGQACVHKAYRGRGVLQALYRQMRVAMQPSFEVLVTEIAKRNTRSLRAHEKVGFQVLHEYPSNTEIWQIVLWNWH